MTNTHAPDDERYRAELIDKLNAVAEACKTLVEQPTCRALRGYPEALAALQAIDPSVGQQRTMY